MISTTMSAYLDAAPLDRLLKEAGAIGIRSTKEMAYRIVQHASRRSRVRTGTMKKGWKRKPFEFMGMKGWFIYNEVPYTVFNEFGTSRMAAQPMLRPALQEVKALLPLAVAKYITLAIAGGGGTPDTGGGDIL